ncbi:amidohydrolase [Plantibacter sp. Mn2098]|uniref:amidohydrolase n=1 Tax=Plantibacter sp. Mn2098 TaxID=3395266 RepID=UPI003BD3840E
MTTTDQTPDAGAAADAHTVDTVIRGVTVLAPTSRPAVGYPEHPADRAAPAEFLPEHSIAISGGTIAWIRPDAEVDVEALTAAGAVIHDAPGRVAIPGMINTHTHSAMTLFRGAAEDVPTASWFNEYIWPMEVNLTDRDVRIGTQLAVAEMLLGGVTTFADHYFSMNEIARVVDEMGARALLAETYFSSQGAEGLDRSAAFAAEWNGKANGRITTALGPHAVYTVDDADLQRTADVARQIGVRSHIHASETMFQTESLLAKRGVTPIQVLHDTGMLDAGVVIGHGTGIIEDDLRWLTPFADRVGIACCSKVYQKHTHSSTPIRMLHDAGITVGIGTDGCASHNTMDMFESVRTMSLVQKDWLRDATWMTSAHALDLLTRQSAATIGREHDLGSLAPGYQADIVLIDVRKPHLHPMNDLAAALVLSVRASDVETVFVAGRKLVDDGRLTSFDLAPVMSEITEAMPRLVDRSHGTTIQTYAP